MKYRIYIDEVGNPDLDSSDNPNHRFLSLTGVILDLAYVAETMHPEMEALKREFFGDHPDEPVILHRKELLKGRQPFDALRDPTVRQRFDGKLLALLAGWNYTAITVCLDKKGQKEQYTSWRYDPYHYCLAVLLERFVLFLRRHAARGDVMAESRGGKEDMRLKAAFCRLLEQGTPFVEPQRFQAQLTSCQLKVKTKQNNIAGLQLADLIAHPSRNEVLLESGLRTEPLAAFGEKVVALLQHKYDRDGDRVFGKKMLCA